MAAHVRPFYRLHFGGGVSKPTVRLSFNVLTHLVILIACEIETAYTGSQVLVNALHSVWSP